MLRLRQRTRLNSPFFLCVFAALLRSAYFDVDTATVVATAGDTVVLGCKVTYSQDYQVSWIRLQRQTSIVLTYLHQRITQDSRFAILNPSLDEWNLQLANVSSKDQGNYSCTINTEKPVSKVVTLVVNAPPTIVYPRYSNEKVEVLENETITLQCNSTGNPRPTITWFKKSFLYDAEKRQKIPLMSDFTEIAKGPSLTVSGTRQEETQFKCEANNSIPSDIGFRTYRIFDLSIHFAPKMVVKPTEIGQALRGETLLDCEVTGNPIEPGNLYWEHEGNKIFANSSLGLYSVDFFPQTQPYAVIMALRIANITDKAFGYYHCRVSNKYGSASASSYLYEIKQSTAKQATKVYPISRDNVVAVSTTILRTTKKTQKPVVIETSTKRNNQGMELKNRAPLHSGSVAVIPSLNYQLIFSVSVSITFVVSQSILSFL